MVTFCSPPPPPQFLEVGRSLWTIFCQSVIRVWVVSTIIDGGDTQTLSPFMEFVWTFCTREAVDKLKHCSHALVPPTSHIVKLSQATPVIFTVRNVVAARLCFHRRLWFCWGGGHAWQGGVCGRGWADRGACVVGGMHSRGVCMAGRTCMVQMTVRILLEGNLVFHVFQSRNTQNWLTGTLVGNLALIPATSSFRCAASRNSKRQWNNCKQGSVYYH